VVTSHHDDRGQAGAPHTAAPGESTGRNGGWTLLWHQGESRSSKAVLVGSCAIR